MRKFEEVAPITKKLASERNAPTLPRGGAPVFGHRTNQGVTYSHMFKLDIGNE